ncbi:toprim domain-containing protein [Methylovulum psychrotolerans]|uniref:DUF5906 domain-containing protein n=1 Tax=Methylovulum psychrotolerans TaxID=1704499 RepID=UPI001BFF5651|nr:DUF5906 domain-containing protein [Methylovulum psychrotolerans]MBT9098412.1 toprim domain-containing protein [Methylovulum psychrotolerans]
MILSRDDEQLFLAAMAGYGIRPHNELNLIPDGKIHRYRVDGDKSGSLNGWYVLFSDGAIPAGAFGSWKTGESVNWCSKAESKLSPLERDEWLRKQHEATRAREAELLLVRKAARAKAAELWGKAVDTVGISPIGENSDKLHPYILKKGVRPYGVKRLKDALLVPLRNAGGTITSLQFIQLDGSKKFLTGGEISGCYFAIGKHGSVLLICEGFATGASLREATGYSVAVAFNAGNLAHVARVLREKLPDHTIIICADNDQDKDVNIGLSKAADAAEQIEAMLAVASFQESDLIDGKTPTDFNDLHALYGLQRVREVIDAAIASDVKVKPKVADAPPVVPRSKQALEDLIDSIDDFDELTGRVVLLVANAGLSRPAFEFLLAKIAKRASVPKSALLDVIKRASGDDGGDGAGGDYAERMIDDLNHKHALLPVGGRVLVMNREYDPVMDRQLLTFSAKTDFETRYMNRKVNGTGLGEFWLEHPRRAEFDGMVFSPGKDQPGYLNLWSGWGCEPRDGCCDLYISFVKDVICSGNAELFTYVMSWCAHLVQYPQVLPETALVFRGREGIGKNTFIDPLRDIVGREHFLMLSSLNQITGRFSGHLSNALLVFCNESVWGGDKSAQGVLKSMITDDVQPIEHKGRDLVMVRSYRRMIFATNENWAVPRGADDRRYVITDVSDARKGDYAYFQAIRDEMRNGGTEALFAELMGMNLEGWHPRSIPACLQVCGWELKIRSGDSIVRWWFDVLQQGWVQKVERQYGEEDQLLWPDKCPSEVLQRSYLRWCTDYKIAHPEHNVVLGKAVREWGIKTNRPRSGNDPKRSLFYLLPPLEQAQAIFSERFALPSTVWESFD